MTDSEREKAVAEIQARRSARGMTDPLNRLRAITEKAVANGARVFQNKESHHD